MHFRSARIGIEALEERFGVVPEDIKQRVNAIEGRLVLQRLYRLAIRAEVWRNSCRGFSLYPPYPLKFRATVKNAFKPDPDDSGFENF